MAIHGGLKNLCSGHGKENHKQLKEEKTTKKTGNRVTCTSFDDFAREKLTFNVFMR